ncbi:diacylglycerol kinase catalytic domain-containing protein [Spiroplasma taiwanense]|uniref:Inorganic polyphosphate/ATP-NAD kinase n=1 Tax=Spiroplasma taiwanense CT-1 TaxID=1276220 RepID=S5MAW8_9MOLU|nr:NAD(+)/NADH kinase [Spiroplasma taiwanense]AGR40913.1 inorganic polyphosphate/ATP-NAD kinase [Spiroplasma taiwanense CT-1]
MLSFNIVKNDYKTTIQSISDFKDKLIKRGWILKEKNPQFVFIFGGDGTFLKAISLYKKQIDDVFFVPFKSGGIGYYTNKNRIDEFDLTLDLIENNTFSIDKFELLEVQNNGDSYLVANELKILNEKSALYIEIFINDEFLEKFHGTGLVISTSNGSTGYMKSAGGAIILPKNSKIFQMQELIPVSTNKFRTLNAPLILNDSHFLTLKLEEKSKEIMIIDTIEVPIIDKYISIKVSNKIIKVITSLEGKKNSKVEILRDIFIKDKEIIE